MAQDSNFGNLPGFGRPLDWNDNAELFPTALNSCLKDTDAFSYVSYYEYWISIANDDIDGVGRMRLITLREITMLAFMNQLTDKPGWDKKVSAHHISHSQLSCTMLHRSSILPLLQNGRKRHYHKLNPRLPTRRYPPMPAKT